MNATTSIGGELAAATIGCRISFTWFGQVKQIEDCEQERAAELFGATAEALKMQKKLLNTKRPEYKAVSKVRGAVRKFWKLSTLPYTEPGVRLLRRVDVAGFSERLNAFQVELAAAVAELDNVFHEMKADAAARLGSLYSAADYPATLADAFGLRFEFPNLAPPEYLATFAPDVFERERRRIASQFEQAAELAESAFLQELSGLVERITETLKPDENGRPRVFRDTLVDNVSAFFERFRRLSIGSSAELVSLVEQAQTALGNATPAALRSDNSLRQAIRANFETVAATISAETSRPARVIRFGGARQPAAAGNEPQPVAAVPEVQPNPQPVPDRQPETVNEPAAADVVELAAADEMGAELAELNPNPQPVPDRQPETVNEPEPVAVVSADIAAAFNLARLPNVQTLPEPVAAVPEVQPNPQPETVNEPAAGIVLKFGNGRTLTIAG